MIIVSTKTEKIHFLPNIFRRRNINASLFSGRLFSCFSPKHKLLVSSTEESIGFE